MRPSFLLFSLFCGILLFDILLFCVNTLHHQDLMSSLSSQQQLVRQLGLTDLALSTEARYTRHPSVSDPLAPFMDHPGSIEHFPSGSFLLPAVNTTR